jgi:C-terminal processing protease CtpA/Prc
MKSFTLRSVCLGLAFTCCLVQVSYEHLKKTSETTHQSINQMTPSVVYRSAVMGERATSPAFEVSTVAYTQTNDADKKSKDRKANDAKAKDDKAKAATKSVDKKATVLKKQSAKKAERAAKKAEAKAAKAADTAKAAMTEAKKEATKAAEAAKDAAESVGEKAAAMTDQASAKPKTEGKPEQTKAKVGPPWVGASLRNEDLAILKITPSSPAAKSELQLGDQIISVEGEQVGNPKELKTELFKAKPEQKLRIVIKRAGVERSLFITLGSQKDRAAAMRK